MSESRRLGDIMVARGQLRPEQVDEALQAQRAAGDTARLGDVIVELGLANDVDVAQAISIQTGLPYVDPVAEPIEAGLVWRLPREMAETHRAIPISRVHQGEGPVPRNAPVRVAMADPRDMAALGEFQFILGAPIRPEVAAPSRIELAVARHYDLEPMARRLLEHVPARLKAAPTTGRAVRELAGHRGLRSVTAEDEGGAFIQLLDFIFSMAIDRDVSDVHLSPTPSGLRVRYRIDGMLRDVLELPQWATAPLISRLKVVADMSVYEHRRPQDGSLSVKHQDRQVDLRVSIMPGQFGPTAVVRLLDPRMLDVDLGELGWDRRSLSRWYRLVSQNQGLVLVVGPTGSGKSTTLYATINRLRSEATHIVTLEDPVEYRVGGISQIQVHSQIGMSFASGIRALLRQDPDIMVIGEIRDAESAEAAVEAANTGHLVLSTVHTGHAVDAVTRLMDLGVQPFLAASALLGVVAQRLVRRVCPDCCIHAPPVREDWERLGIEPIDLGPDVRRVGEGCPACEYIGYRGRVGVFEALRVDEAMRDAIHTRATDRELWAIARKSGLRTLIEDALDKVAHGMTTLEEVARVIPPDRWERAALAGTGFHIHSSKDALATEAAAAATSAEPVDQRQVVVSEAPTAPETAPPAPPAATDVQPEPEDDRGRPSVLAVDDHEEILQLVGITLEDSYDVRFARDGQEALDEVARQHPDAIVLDVMMPRVSGYEVAERLKTNDDTKDIPILILSARGDSAHVKQGFKAGADDYLPKPFDPEELELRVRALLRRSGRI